MPVKKSQTSISRKSTKDLKSPNRLRSSQQWNRWRALIFVGLFAVIGGSLLLLTHAQDQISVACPTDPGASYGAYGTDRGSHLHAGIDIGVDHRPIYAAESGQVMFAGQNNEKYDGYQKTIDLRGASGRVYRYAHLSVMNVSAGQGVTAGQNIGTSGDGDGTLPSHLHWEIRTDGGGTGFNGTLDPSWAYEHCGSSPPPAGANPISFSVAPALPASKPAVWRAGTWYLGGEGSRTISQFAYGESTESRVLLCDWDGNGTQTPAVIRGNQWLISNSQASGIAQITIYYGNPGDIPICGDWDGNGTQTPGVVRSGQWFLRNSVSSGGADVAFYYGNASDTPLVGDWDGNKTETPGIWRSGTFYLRNSNSSGIADGTVMFGIASDIPLVGDWNNDGYDTTGIFRNGEWHLTNSNLSHSSRTDIVFNFGSPGDKPLVWR